LGGEYGGAALMTIESAPPSRRGFLGSLPQAAASAGIMLATGVFALCNHFLNEAEFLAWGWRIPFLLSIIMLAVGMYIRMHIEETCDFQMAETNETSITATAEQASRSLPIVELFRKHPKNIFLALGARLAETVSSNTINAFGISYIAIQLGMGRQIPLNGMLIASIIGIVLCPVIGHLSDRFGQRPIYMIGALFCAVFIFPFFMLLNTRDTSLITVALVIAYICGPTMMFAVQPTMFAKMFGTRVRYTGLSFAYQFSAILGGMTPLIASTLLAVNDGKPWFVGIYMAIISIISFLCVWKIRLDNTKNE
jgi:MHS family shikimate/dehydroshikimate transporter-like MFS transporter